MTVTLTYFWIHFLEFSRGGHVTPLAHACGRPCLYIGLLLISHNKLRTYVTCVIKLTKLRFSYCIQGCTVYNLWLFSAAECSLVSTNHAKTFINCPDDATHNKIRSKHNTSQCIYKCDSVESMISLHYWWSVIFSHRKYRQQHCEFDT